MTGNLLALPSRDILPLFGMSLNESMVQSVEVEGPAGLCPFLSCRGSLGLGVGATHTTP